MKTIPDDNTVINGAGAGYNLGPGIDFAAQFNMVESGSAMNPRRSCSAPS